MLDQKIKERTADLNSIVKGLSVTVHAKDLEITTIRAKHAEIIKSIESLCAVAKYDIEDPITRKYFV